MTTTTATEISVGDWVVVDITGREMMSCMEVGRVVEIYADGSEIGDDGDIDGNPRPIYMVELNGEHFAPYAVVDIHAKL